MRRLIPFLFCLALLGTPALAGARVFVYYPSLARPLAIQEALAKKCPGLEISVFGRLADLLSRETREFRSLAETQEELKNALKAIAAAPNGSERLSDDLRGELRLLSRTIAAAVDGKRAAVQ